MNKVVIYKIENKINNKKYIGKTINWKRRQIDHKSSLKNNRHFNKHLQRSYNKYGSSEFYFIIIEKCTKLKLSFREQYWIDHFDKNILYNQILFVEDLKNERNPFFGKNHSEKSKKLMSVAKKGKYLGKENPNYGNKSSKETRLKMVINNSRTKLTIKQVLKIKHMLLKEEYSHQTIANKFKISRSIITRISSGTRWADVTGGPIKTIVV